MKSVERLFTLPLATRLILAEWYRAEARRFLALADDLESAAEPTRKDLELTRFAELENLLKKDHSPEERTKMIAERIGKSRSTVCRRRADALAMGLLE